MSEPINRLYVDGGVIQHNPSSQGGTWAFLLLNMNVVEKAQSGMITPQQAGLPAITNNLTEMLAMLKGLAALPASWKGTVYSDSQVTLGRIFQGWKWTNIPRWMHLVFQAQTMRLAWWPGGFQYVLLDGHPTKAQLAAGIGKRGHPVSEYNVLCDQWCQGEAQKFLEKEMAKVPA